MDQGIFLMPDPNVLSREPENSTRIVISGIDGREVADSEHMTTGTRLRSKDLALTPPLLLFSPYLLVRKSRGKPLMTIAPHQVTRLLKEWSDGDERALEQLMALVHDELHRLAHQHMRRERPGHILQTSALINEAYLRLVEQPEIRWENRNHFFGIAARLMRRILVDDARKRNAAKRGGSLIQVPLDEVTSLADEQAANVAVLDNALKILETMDARQGQIVELRFFGGLSIEETANVLQVSPGTVMRDWTFARAWLRNEMTRA